MTTDSVLLVNALRLPLPDWQALAHGRTIAAMPWNFISVGQTFALFPDETDDTKAQFWAVCEFCKSIDDLRSLEALSRLSVRTVQELEDYFRQRDFLILAFLRVYQIPKPVEVIKTVEREFLSLTEPTLVSKSLPVLSDVVFNQRKQQLNELRPPLHSELEELQSAIAQLTDPAAKELDRKIRTFLGWTHDNIKQPNPDLDWIRAINQLGTATTGGNFEKGTAFEQIVHKSLTFLGFELDPSAKGGAGGMDLYCTKPYPLVGECKAGQGIPGNTVYELDKLGCVHLGKSVFDTANKLIIGPGNPTTQLKLSAKEFKISIIHPMTLQKLVELQAKYPNSVNLVELKDFLLPGQIDDKVKEYIDQVSNRIRVRSHIVEAVKKLTEDDPHRSQFEVSEIRVQYNNASFAKSFGGIFENEAFHDLLIELSSPLTGYLGRLKGTSLQTERFYFLRDLPMD